MSSKKTVPLRNVTSHPAPDYSGGVKKIGKTGDEKAVEKTVEQFFRRKFNLNPNEMIPRKIACQMLGVKPDTLRKWEKAKRIVGYKITATLTTYKLAEVQALIDDAAAEAKKTFAPGPAFKEAA